MKYYIVETDKSNPLPKFRGIYTISYYKSFIKNKADGKIDDLVFEMCTKEETFIPELITSPFCMLSRELFQVVMLYMPDIQGRMISFVEKEKRKYVTYIAPFLEERKQREIDEAIFSHAPLFYLSGISSRRLVIRMDLLESILRRRVWGLKIEELLLNTKTGGDNGSNCWSSR